MPILLQHLRETASLTQRDLARKAGVTQETISQLEAGKSARPRLDTLTKLRDALELPDLRPGDLLDPVPLGDDEELRTAGERLVNLLKVLPGYPAKHDDGFWQAFSTHLDYRDLYPARKITGNLQVSMAGSGRNTVDHLAQYALMFFDPADEEALRILADRGSVGPGTVVARLWCREVTEAAWVIHRATLTSYPAQIGALVTEASEAKDPARIVDLTHSVYDVVRSQAFVHAPVDRQIQALRDDPSSDVVHEIAHAGGHAVQTAALDVPRAWVGLASNKSLGHDVLERLAAMILERLDHEEDDSPAHRALFEICERKNLPRPLAERISQVIDNEKYYNGSWITSAVLAIREALDDLSNNTAGEGRPRTPVPGPQAGERPSWLRRFLRNPRS